MDELINCLLHTIVIAGGFEFASIHLVNHESGVIEHMACMRNPYIKDSTDLSDLIGVTHDLNPPQGKIINIHALVLKRQKLLIIKGWHPNFDRDVYDQFKQKSLIRIFATIIAENPSLDIGTIEAGHHTNRKSSIEKHEIEMVSVLAQFSAIAMKNILLKSKHSSTPFHETVRDILNGK